MQDDAYQKLIGFFAQYKLQTYKKREVVVRADDEPGGVYYLVKGYLKEYALSQDGGEFTTVFFRPDDCFPLPWAIHNFPHLRTIEALTPVELYKAPKDAFLAFIKEHPDVVFALLSRMSSRLSGVLQRMEYIVLGNAQTKVASMLYLLADRFGVQEKEGMAIQVPLTHREVALLIGLARETVSIEMEKLSKEGILQQSGGKVTVINMTKLKEVALMDNFSQFA